MPITTERSFNAETFVFNADYPLQLNFVAKDFKQDDTGLEYIGRRNQQMGDADSSHSSRIRPREYRSRRPTPPGAAW